MPSNTELWRVSGVGPDDPVLVAQLLWMHPLASGEPVGVSDGHAGSLRAGQRGELQPVDVVVRKSFAGGQDGDLEAAAAEREQLHRSRRLDEPHSQPGFVLINRATAVGTSDAAAVGNAPTASRPSRRSLRPASSLVAAAMRSSTAPACRISDLPGGGGRTDTSSVPLEQGRARECLEARHLPGYGGLGVAECLGGGAG